MQVNENVNANGLLTVGTNVKKSGNNATGGKDSGNFASIFAASTSNEKKSNDSISKMQGTRNDSESKMDDSKYGIKDTNQTKSESADGAGTVKEDNLNVKNDTKVVDNEATDETSMVENEVATMDGNEENVEEILEVVGQILQQIMSFFDFSPDELRTQMETIGMEQVSDLFETDGMKELFLSVNSAELPELVVNEELNQAWMQFDEQVTDLIKTLPVESQQIESLAENMTIEDVLETNSATLETQLSELTPVMKDVQETKEDVQVVVEKYAENVLSDAEQESALVYEKKDSEASGNLNQQDKKEDSVFDSSLNRVQKKEMIRENPIVQAVEMAVDQVQEMVNDERTTVSGRAIVEQIVEQIRVNVRQDTTSMEMQLYPEHLGKIQINVVSKDGVMTARIVAETDAARQAIEGGLSNLKEAMEQQDLKVDAIEVMVSTAGFEWNDEQQEAYEQQGGSRRNRKLDLSELDEVDDSVEAAEIEKMRQTGSSVSYTA